MNRYKVTFSDDTIMRLYANTKDDLPIPCFNDKSVVLIERDTDMSYMKYIKREILSDMTIDTERFTNT